jgi:hypothetical protein
LQSWFPEEKGSSIKQVINNRKTPHQHLFCTGPIHELMISMRDNRKKLGFAGDNSISARDMIHDLTRAF